jgi:hypothetical protein
VSALKTLMGFLLVFYSQHLDEKFAVSVTTKQSEVHGFLKNTYHAAIGVRGLRGGLYGLSAASKVYADEARRG